MLIALLFILTLGLSLSQGGPFGTSSSFRGGDKVIFRVDETTCPAGSIDKGLTLIRGSYECVDYQGKRWIRPFDAGLALYREINLKDNFSVEFNFLAFKEGCPYVSVTLFTEEGLKRAKAKDRYGILSGIYVLMTGTCDSVEAGIDTTPKEANALREYFRKTTPQKIHKVALSVRNGMASIYLDGKKIAMEPFNINPPIRGIGFYFYRRFATDVAYADSPALIGDVRVALYTHEKTTSKPVPTPKPKVAVPPSPQVREEVTLPEYSQAPKPKVSRPQTVSGVKCIPSTGIGEASVIDGDFASAKAEALARAKWDAIEKALGVTTSVKTIVHNFKLLDEVIKNEVGGFIKDVKVLKEETYADMVRVKVTGCVYPKEAEKAISLISRDTAFSVIILTDDQGRVELDEMNPVTTELVNILNQQGFKVYDFAGDPNVNPYDIEKIISQRRFILLRAYMSRVLSGAMIVGKVKLIPSTRMGQDIGYGIRATFNVVTARLTYYLLTWDGTGVRIVASGSLSAQGRGINIEDAKFKAMEALARRLGGDIVGKLDRFLAYKRKVVSVEVKGVRSTEDNFRIKGRLQRIPWVESVEDVGIGRFRVVYLDNTVYLANAIERIPELRLINFTPTEIYAELR